MAAGTFRSVYRISQPANWRSELVLELRELPARRRLNTGIRGSRIEDVTPAGMISPALAPSAEDCGPIPVFQALRKDNLNRLGSPQHV
jgi:hypothetical protein